MSDADLSVDLEQRIVEVGSAVRGRLRRAGDVDDLAADRHQPVRSVRLTLGYKTEGRGSPDERTVTDCEFPVDDYGRVDATFDLPVPQDGPVSYDGRRIRVLWTVVATVDVRLRRDPTTRTPVLVIPAGGWGLYDRPHPLRP